MTSGMRLSKRPPRNASVNTFWDQQEAPVATNRAWLRDALLADALIPHKFSNMKAAE